MFLIAAVVVALGFFVLIFLPQLPLRTQSGIQAAQQGAGEVTDSPATASAHAAGAAAPTSVEPPVDGADRSDTAPSDGRCQRVTSTGRRHEAGAHQATGLDSVPADHLPEGVRTRE